MKQAKIIGFYGSWGSGLGFLKVLEGGEEKNIPCENSSTVRALDAMFPGFISPGHSIDNTVIKDEEIVYCMDDMGLILGGLDYA